jgi:5-methylcytosine-specific restriction enzyme A
MAWGKESGRTVPLPRAWKMIRANVLKRDSYQCQWRREDTGVLCLAHATDVDHIDDPSNHKHSNLQSLCSYHHKQKTAQQGGLANAAKYRKQKSHPGVQYLD